MASKPVFINQALERVTDGTRTIDTDHGYIHEGKLFTAPVFISALAAAGSNKITILTPSVASGKYIHYRPALISTSGDKVSVDLYEASSGNSGGSDVTAINRNRVMSSTATTMQAIKSGVTVTTNGTLIDKQYIGGGTNVGGSSQGGTIGQEHEMVLKQNTLYTIVVTNGSSASNNILVTLKWYEENYA